MLKPADRINFTLHCTSEIEPLETVWRMLEAVPECSIHQTYDWCRAWIEETRATPLIITCVYANGPKSGKTAFILPLTVQRLGLFRVAGYIGAEHNNVNFGVFSDFFLQDCNDETMAEIRQQIAALPLGVDYIHLDRQSPERAGQVHPFSYWPTIESQNHAFQVTLDGGIDAVLARSNGKRRRKKLRTSERRLDELGGYDYVQAKSPEEAKNLLNAFFAQKAARFEQHRLPNAFADERIRAVFHRLSQESLNLQRKMIELHAIRLRQHDGLICAVSAISRKGSEAICQFSSIAMGKTEHASPGELLFFLVIHDACDTGARVFDFGIGDAQFKRSWCDQETPHFDNIIATSTWGSVGALTASKITGLKRVVKNRPTMFKVAKTARAWMAPKQR